METRKEIENYYNNQKEQAYKCLKIIKNIKKDLPELLKTFETELSTCTEPNVAINCFQNLDRVEFKRTILQLSEYLDIKFNIMRCHDIDHEGLTFIADGYYDNIQINLRSYSTIGCTIKKVTKTVDVFESDCLQELNGQVT